MTEMQKKYYEKRAAMLVKNLQSRHFEAYYCSTKEDALDKALSLIPEGSSVGWGGSVTCQQIGPCHTNSVYSSEYCSRPRRRYCRRPCLEESSIPKVIASIISNFIIFVKQKRCFL